MIHLIDADKQSLLLIKETAFLMFNMLKHGMM